MEQKINVEVKKVNKKTKQIEWTDTLEIPYEVDEKISDEDKKTIADEISKRQEKDNNKKENSLLNTTVLKMEGNPFHQPSMNTYEFENDDNVIIANISKDNNESISENDEIKALEKLLENKIINDKEFEEKKKIILSKK